MTFQSVDVTFYFVDVTFYIVDVTFWTVLQPLSDGNAQLMAPKVAKDKSQWSTEPATIIEVDAWVVLLPGQVGAHRLLLCPVYDSNLAVTECCIWRDAAFTTIFP